jgi:PAS domain-containing protein
VFPDARQIIAGFDEGRTVQDREFRVIYQNRMMRQRFGDQVEQHCYEVYEQRFTVCPNSPVSACFADGKIHAAKRSVAIDGADYLLENIASPIRDRNDTFIAAVESCHDITRRKAAEQG